jgi:hypothetical protein
MERLLVKWGVVSQHGSKAGNGEPAAWLVALLIMLAGCESATQTAIRENEPPAIAYVVAAQSGKPLPTAVIIQPANNQ